MFSKKLSRILVKDRTRNNSNSETSSVDKCNDSLRYPGDSDRVVYKESYNQICEYFKSSSEEKDYIAKCVELFISLMNDGVEIPDSVVIIPEYSCAFQWNINKILIVVDIDFNGIIDYEYFENCKLKEEGKTLDKQLVSDFVKYVAAKARDSSCLVIFPKVKE